MGREAGEEAGLEGSGSNVAEEKRPEGSGWGEGGPIWGTSEPHFLFAGISASGSGVSAACSSSRWLFAVLSVTAAPDSSRGAFLRPTRGSLGARTVPGRGGAPHLPAQPGGLQGPCARMLRGAAGPARLPCAGLRRWRRTAGTRSP